MMRNKHAYPCLCFVRYAQKGEKQDEYCWTVICSTALLLQRWNFSSLFSAHNSFWQLHRHAIRLSCRANWVCRQSRRLVCRLSYTDMFDFLWGGAVLLSLHSQQAGCWFDPLAKNWKRKDLWWRVFLQLERFSSNGIIRYEYRIENPLKVCAEVYCGWMIQIRGLQVTCEKTDGLFCITFLYQCKEEKLTLKTSLGH